MQGKRILIADDEIDIIELLDYALTKEGYEVKTAGDGKEAIRKARLFNPDIILLDIMMPHNDGIEVCRTLRNESAFDETLIVILTARGEEYSEIAGFEAGADDYVTKPIKLRSLLYRLEAILKRGRKPQANVITLDNLRIDREKYTVLLNEETVKISELGI